MISYGKTYRKTPIFEGEDAITVLKEMQEAPTQEDKEFAKEIRELFYSQNNILQTLFLYAFYIFVKTETSFRIYFYNPIQTINFFLIFFQIFKFVFFNNIEAKCTCICIYSYKS